MINVDQLDGYTFLDAVSFNNELPLNVIRFGDNFYVGYYGGSSLPSVDTAVSLLFTPIANQSVLLYYIKLPQ